MEQNCLFNCNGLLYISFFIPQFQSEEIKSRLTNLIFFRLFFSKYISCNCTLQWSSLHLFLFFIDNYIHHSMQYSVDFCCWTNINHSLVQPEPNGRNLRWLDTVFQGQYLPSLSINYVPINKVLEKLPPQLY